MTEPTTCSTLTRRILRLVRMTIEAKCALATPVAMRGEMAGDPRFTRLLLGRGLRRFSMQPGALLGIKEIILAADTRELERHTDGWNRT